MGLNAVSKRALDPVARCAKSKNSNSPFLQSNRFEFYHLRQSRPCHFLKGDMNFKVPG
jgi:hypothetical protein